MKCDELIENVKHLEERITDTEQIYFKSIKKLREIQGDLSKLDVGEHLLGVIRPFLIEWGTMARVVGQKGLNWEGYGHKIQELEAEFAKLRGQRFLSIDFYNENISNTIKTIYNGLRKFPKLGGLTTISKVLHLLNPELFVMWDINIREVYQKKNRLVNDTASGYLEFLKENQNEIMECISDIQRETGKTTDEAEQEIRSKFNNKTLARIVDEYNYITYTLLRNRKPNTPKKKSTIISKSLHIKSKNVARIVPKQNMPLGSYVCNPKHTFYATKCEELLKNFPNLNVQEVRCHGKKGIG